jgi:acyl-CoA dehydrogenase
MDWTLSEEQEAAAGLAAQILTDKLTHERLLEIEGSDGGWAVDEWRALADAGLLGLALPEADGGAGLGIVESCLVLEQVGRAVAPVPYLATVVTAAGTLARFGSDELRAAWLPGVIAGDVVLTAALTGPPLDAERDGDGWRVSGQASFVPFGQCADGVLVPVSGAGGDALLLVDPRGDGATVEPIRTTNGVPEALLTFTGLRVDAAGAVVAGRDQTDDAVRWMRDRTTVGICALAAGVAGRAVELTGAYASQREQFGSPIATFQAVAHRAADAYTDAAAIRFTMLHAAWRLDAGLPAADELDVAKFWAADGGQRVAHAAQHLHGGIGVDRDYPLHRYFLWSKVLELTMGGATERLVALGGRLAATPVGAG